MIPKPYIAKWQVHAPWNEFLQVDQDEIPHYLRPDVKYNQNMAFEWLKNELTENIER